MVAIVSGIASRGDYRTAADIIARSVEGKALAESMGVDPHVIRESMALALSRYLSRPPTKNVDAETRRLMADTRVKCLIGAMEMRESDMEAVVEEFLRRRVTSGDLKPARTVPEEIKPRDYEPVSAEPLRY